MRSKFNKEELKDFESILLAKKEKSELQLKELEEQYAEISESGKDENSIENSAYDNQLKFLATYIARSSKHIQDIESALYRIKTNSYGICAVTGEMIDKRRLLAVPTTTKSIEGKNLSDAKQ